MSLFNSEPMSNYTIISYLKSVTAANLVPFIFNNEPMSDLPPIYLMCDESESCSVAWTKIAFLQYSYTTSMVVVREEYRET